MNEPLKLLMLGMYPGCLRSGRKDVSAASDDSARWCGGGEANRSEMGEQRADCVGVRLRMECVGYALRSMDIPRWGLSVTRGERWMGVCGPKVP